MKKTKLVVAILMVLVLLVTLSSALPVLAKDGNSQNQWLEGVDGLDDPGLLPPNIMPVVVLQGSWYEMGVQYGQQAGQWIEIRAENKWADLFSTGVTEQEVKDSLDICAGYMSEYDLDFVLEMIQGMADGAAHAGYDVKYYDVLELNHYWFHMPAHEHEHDVCPECQCSSWSAWGDTTADGSLIAGASCDNWIIEPCVAIVAFPDEGNMYLGSALAGEVVDMPCLSSAGVFIGSGGGFANSLEYDETAIDHNAAGLTVHAMDLYILSQLDNADEAAEWMANKQWPASENQHVADIWGNAGIVERTAAMGEHEGYIRTEGMLGESDFLYRANNYANPDVGWMFEEPKEYIDHVGWVSYAPTGGATVRSVPRMKEMWTMLEQYNGLVDVEFAKMMWRFPGDGPGTDRFPMIANGMNVRLGFAHAYYDEASESVQGKLYLSTGPAAREVWPLGTAYYGHPPQPDQTNAFFALSLASSPGDEYWALRADTSIALTSAYQEFMYMTAVDTGYGILDELYDEAVDEFYKAINLGFAAMVMPNDNAEAYLWSKCFTAFTRAQVKANQVYNHIEPPANDPMDLGLAAYNDSYWP
ncbi:hypothetical protein ACFLS8_03775 [Chloroflexota bacterium]